MHMHLVRCDSVWIYCFPDDHEISSLAARAAMGPRLTALYDRLSIENRFLDSNTDARCIRYVSRVIASNLLVGILYGSTLR